MTAILGLAAIGTYIWLVLTYGWLRASIGALMFLGISWFWIRYWRSMMNVPPEPELADVSEYGLKYVCSMCGLELRVEVAAKDRAPTHCGEPMVLQRVGGKPPLRSV